MSRPQGVQAGSSSGNRIDAALCAHSGTTVERNFSAADLPRLGEAGAQDSQLSARFSFSQLEGRVAIDGALRGVVTLTCQRCLRALEFPLEETFQVVLVQDEAELAEEPGGYEPVLADPARFDLQALAEDQALLALPLVPRHEPGQCNPSGAVQVEPEIDESGTQKPFGNLRDLMRGR